ncbi:MAG: hypothetical protein KGZ59_07360 [Chitinophagaceae bacterium]|nr:hypothetical protein [Chitinophagaceae bacterium]
MKKVLLIILSISCVTLLFAQTETATNSTDTTEVGVYKIPNKTYSSTDEVSSKRKKHKSDIVFGYSSKRKQSNVSTSWWILDLGFANFRDQTNYTAAQAGNYFQTYKNGPVTENSMNLINGKSLNVNLWIFMQKLNVSNHVLNLKYGLGLEMYNYRFENSLSYRKNPFSQIFNDSIIFTKNKLYAGYLTVPLMVNFSPTPTKKNSFKMSFGMSFGYLISSRNKQISNERGKQKIKGNFDLEPFRVATITEIGLGPVTLYGSYSLNSLHKSSTGLQQYPYAIGVRLSNR